VTYLPHAFNHPSESTGIPNHPFIVFVATVVTAVVAAVVVVGQQNSIKS